MKRRDTIAALVIAGVAAFVAVKLVQGHDPDVAHDALINGVLLGTIGGWVLPASVYYALFRFVKPVWAAVAFVLSVVPVGYYLFFVLIITAGYVDCPPDAYECPL